MPIFKTISSILNLNIHENHWSILIFQSSWSLTREPGCMTFSTNSPFAIPETSSRSFRRWSSTYLRRSSRMRFPQHNDGNGMVQKGSKALMWGGGATFFQLMMHHYSWRESSAHWKYVNLWLFWSLPEQRFTRGMHLTSLRDPTRSSDPSSCQLFMKPCWASWLRPIYSVHQSCKELLWASLRVECSRISHTYCVYLSLPQPKFTRLPCCLSNCVVENSS